MNLLEYFDSTELTEKIKDFKNCKESCPKNIKDYIEPIGQYNTTCKGFSYLNDKEL